MQISVRFRASLVLAIGWGIGLYDVELMELDLYVGFPTCRHNQLKHKTVIVKTEHY